MNLTGEVVYIEYDKGHTFIKAPIPDDSIEDGIYTWLSSREQTLGEPIESLVMTAEKRISMGAPPGDSFLWVGFQSNKRPNPGQRVTIEIED